MNTLVRMGVLASVGFSCSVSHPADVLEATQSKTYDELCAAWALVCPPVAESSLTDVQWRAAIMLGQAFLLTDTRLAIPGDEVRGLLPGWLAQFGLEVEAFPSLQMVMGMPWRHFQIVPGQGFHVKFEQAGSELILSNGLRTTNFGTEIMVSLREGEIGFSGLLAGPQSGKLMPVQRVSWSQEEGMVATLGNLRVTGVSPDFFAGTLDEMQFILDSDSIVETVMAASGWLFAPGARIVLDKPFFVQMRAVIGDLVPPELLATVDSALAQVLSVISNSDRGEIRVSLASRGMRCTTAAGGAFPVAVRTDSEFGFKSIRVDQASGAVDVDIFGLKAQVGLPGGLWSPAFGLRSIHFSREELVLRGPLGIRHAMKWPDDTFDAETEIASAECAAL